MKTETRNSLNIRPSGGLDFLSLGALVHRLDPGIIPFRKATDCAIHVSGGEFNVSANLADCFRLNCGMATAMVDYPIGDLITERVRAMGVKPFYKHFKHDGVLGPNMATVYSDRGQGLRAPVVFYNRANEAAAQLKPGDFNWKAICSQGLRWFHSGGIFASLSPTTAKVIVEGMRVAKAAGAIVSFDLNYREKLWNNCGGKKHAAEVLNHIIKHVDVLIAGEADMRLLLGVLETVSTDKALDPEAFFAIARDLKQKHPRIKIITTTLREVISANRHTWGAAAWVDGRAHVSPVCTLDVFDRVGSGDGYAAGFIYGLLAGESADEAVKLGWAHGALLTTYPGDTTMSTLEEVRAVAAGGSARIKR